MRAVQVIVLVLWMAGTAKPQNSPPSRMPDDVAIFAIRPNNQSFDLDPIVIVHYGADQTFKVVPSLNEPTRADSIDTDNQAFGKTFYKPEAVISVFKGGERSGLQPSATPTHRLAKKEAA